MEQRAEILLVTRNLPPLVGGMESLIHRTAGILGKHYRLTVVGPRGCGRHLDPGIDYREVPSSLAGFLFFATLACLGLSRSRHFCLAMGGSGLAAACLYLLKTLRGIPTACYVHGLDIVVDNGIYQRVFLPALRRVDTIIANSGNTRRLCIERGLDAGRISVLHPGCDMQAVDRQGSRQALLEMCGRDSELVLLSVGRIVPRKGLLRFVQEAFAKLLRVRPDTILVIVGDSPQDSLAHRNTELDALVELVEEQGWDDNVFFLGKVDADTLMRCYAAADALVFPLVPVPGDVEGFGMVAIEAAAQGTLTVAFDEGGVSDAIAEGISGRLLRSGDYAAMVSALAGLKVSPASTSACREHAKAFGWDSYEEGLLAIMQRIAAVET